MYEIWSAGLETWERVTLSEKDVSCLTSVHSKQVGYSLYTFYNDPLGRWFRRNVGPLAPQQQEQQ